MNSEELTLTPVDRKPPEGLPERRTLKQKTRRPPRSRSRAKLRLPPKPKPDIRKPEYEAIIEAFLEEATQTPEYPNHAESILNRLIEKGKIKTSVRRNEIYLELITP